MLGIFAALGLVTQTFIVVICFLGIYFLVKFNRRTADLGPTLLTTIGILGTFVGVALGLLKFDTGNVEASIPKLLNGLKTAFLASVFGVGFAILLKLREFFLGTGKSAESESPSDEVTGADLVRHLSDIRTALTGPEDGSLLSQIRLLRLDSNDRLDALKTAMGEALQKLSEMGSQALIEALRDVIRDFNDRITEQFGENFKQLNVAVGNLLVWQEQYKATVETTVARLGDVTRLVGDLTGNFAVMVERSGRFADVADRLGAMLVALETSEARLREQSEALAALLLKASGSLPEIERKIEELSAQMANAVRENQRVVGAAMTESAAVLRGIVEQLRQDVAKVSGDLSGTVTRNQELVGRALTENTAAIRASVDGTQRDMAGTSAEFNRQVRELADRTREQVAAVAGDLSTMVTRNQETVGRALTENATAIRNSFESAQRDMTATNAEFSRQLRELVDKTKDQIATVAGELSGMVTKNQEMVGKALTENATAIRNSVDSTQRDMTGTNAEFNRQLRELADKTKEQVATLDAALQRELETALRSLAQQFTAISGRFALDYGNLADTLKRIVDSTKVPR